MRTCAAPAKRIVLLSNSADRPPKHLAARNRHGSTRLTHAVYTRTRPDSERPTVASWSSRATQLSPQDRRTAPPFRLSSAALTAATESTLPQTHAPAYVRGRGNVSYPTDRDARMSPTGARKGVPSQQRDCRLLACSTGSLATATTGARQVAQVRPHLSRRSRAMCIAAPLTAPIVLG